MASTRKSADRESDINGDTISECSNLAQVVGDLADVKAQACLLFSHSLAMKDPTDAAACGFAARNLKRLAERGLARLDQLREGRLQIDPARPRRKPR